MNTLNLKPVKLNKVDSAKNPIVTDAAKFELTSATAGEKVLDESGVEQDSIELTTSLLNPYIVMPIQKTGHVSHNRDEGAPAGYNLLTMPIEVVIGADGSVASTLGAVSLEEVALSGSDADRYSKAYNVVNKTASELPKAGGMGTIFLTLVSTAILFAAAFLLRRRSRVARASV